MPVPSKPLPQTRSPSICGTLSESCGSRRRSSAMTSTEKAASSSASASGPDLEREERERLVLAQHRMALPAQSGGDLGLDVRHVPALASDAGRGQMTLRGEAAAGQVEPHEDPDSSLGRGPAAGPGAGPGLEAPPRQSGLAGRGEASPGQPTRGTSSEPPVQGHRQPARCGGAVRHRGRRLRACAADASALSRCMGGEQAMCHGRPGLGPETGPGGYCLTGVGIGELFRRPPGRSGRAPEGSITPR